MMEGSAGLKVRRCEGANVEQTRAEVLAQCADSPTVAELQEEVEMLQRELAASNDLRRKLTTKLNDAERARKADAQAVVDHLGPALLADIRAHLAARGEGELGDRATCKVEGRERVTVTAPAMEHWQRKPWSPATCKTEATGHEAVIEGPAALFEAWRFVLSYATVPCERDCEECRAQDWGQHERWEDPNRS